MVAIWYKWFLLLSLTSMQSAVGPDRYREQSAVSRQQLAVHPYFISVTEIQHNAGDKTLEISCKLFTDDLEKILRQNYKTAVDLVNVKDKAAMDRLVSDYVLKHFSICLEGKPVKLKFLGFEKQEEAVYSYWQVDNVAAVKKISISNSLLYDYKKEQMGIVHVIVGGVRKSNKLNNPDSKLEVEF